MENIEKFVAPSIDYLLACLSKNYRNPSKPSQKLKDEIEKIFSAAKEIMPIKNNNEAKVIWIRVPRGNITDFGNYEEMLEDEVVLNYDEYENMWKEEYPNEFAWYELDILEDKDFRGIYINEYLIVNARYDDMLEGSTRDDEIVIMLCELMIKGIADCIELRKQNKYEELVKNVVPYKYRKGLIKRKDLWDIDPEEKKRTFEGLSENVYKKFCTYVENGDNSIDKIERIEKFTAFDFFNACAIGYKACGYDGIDLPIVDQYLKHADGRDEGLTGRRYGSKVGEGVPLNDYKAWDNWYNDKSRHGGHPWEVCRGGNSTHVSLNVSDYSDDGKKGYYFIVAGKSFGRSVETVNFYVAIKEAGYPIIISDGEVILARFKATDYIGIVPHKTPTRYCESLFDKKYGTILDFMHVYDEEIELYGSKIEWLPLVTS